MSRIAGTVMLTLAALATFPGSGFADDQGVTGLKLVLIDKYAAAGRAKVTFVSKDPAAGAIHNGSGSGDPADVSGSVRICPSAAPANVAVYALPAPWVSNTTTISKYVNTAAAPGGPGAKAVIVKPGVLLKVVAKNLGDGDAVSGDDGPTDLNLNDPPGTCTVAMGDTLDVEVTVEDAATPATHRMCSRFVVQSVVSIAGGTGCKVVSKTSVAGVCGVCGGAVTPTTTTTTEPTTTTTTTLVCGTFLTTWGSLGSADGQFNNPNGVATDASGNVYVADTSNHRIQKFDASGTFLAKWGTGGTGTGQFVVPVGVATDASGHVYVADTGNQRIQKFDASGTFLTTWGTFGTGIGQFNFPHSVATDPSGNVYVSEFENNRIQKFDASGLFLTTWGTGGSGDGQFILPRGVATDAAGNVYVADGDNHRIQKFDATGTFLAKWGSLGSADGQFNTPNGVATYASGNVYVADSSNHRIQKFDASGTFLAKWGTNGSGDGQFSFPHGVATDADGNVYVVDNHRVQKFACP